MLSELLEEFDGRLFSLYNLFVYLYELNIIIALSLFQQKIKEDLIEFIDELFSFIMNHFIHILRGLDLDFQVHLLILSFQFILEDFV